MTDVAIEPYESGVRAAWDAFVRTASGASVYHDSWWMDVVSACFPHENLSSLARRDNGDICAVLPLFRVAEGTSARLVSVPLRDQAGVLGDPAGTRALVRHAIELTQRTGCAYLALKQGHELGHEASVHTSELVPLFHWVTQEIGLPLTSSAGVRESALRNVRKAERHGLALEVGADAVLMERFHRMFRQTRKRLGVPTYSREFFQTLARFPDHATVILCSLGAQDLAGAIILHANRRAAYAYAANSLARRELRAADLVVWTALRWADEQGFESFDFGADSPLQTELIRFKQKWGAKPRTLPYYYYLHRARRIPLHDSSAPQWRWIRRSVSFFPDAAFDRLSQWVVRRAD